MTTPQFQPNMGRDELKEPPSVDWMFKDLDHNKPVEIMAWNNSTSQRHCHWAIGWEIDDNNRRLLQVVQENDKYGRPTGHLTNWGAVTKAYSRPATHYKIATLTLANRQGLEQIANAEQVLIPDGNWNCQDWVHAVLKKGVDQGIFTKTQVSRAFGKNNRGVFIVVHFLRFE